MNSDALLPAWRELAPLARRVEVRHIRARTFRLWGLVETVLYAVGFLILLPVLALLTLFTDTDPLAGGGGGGGASGSRGVESAKQRARRRLGAVSRYWHYHHDVELRVVDGRGQALFERRERPASAEIGQRLLGAVLQWADSERIVVEERITPDEAPTTASILITRWFGGRPLLFGPDLREAEALERDLAEAGFSFERSEERAVLRRAVRPNVGEAWISLVVLIGISAVLVVTAVPAAIVLAVVVVAWALLHPLEAGRVVVEQLYALVGVPERHELVVTPNALAYRRGHLKLLARASTGGDRVFAVGYTEALGWDREVSFEDLQLRIFAESQILALPPELTRGAGALAEEWVVSTLLSLRQSTEAHDFRSKCAYCGSLYDWDAEKACPQCGGTRLDRLR